MTRLQMMRAALRLRNCTAAEKVVLLQLGSIANTSCIAEMSQARIANATSLSLSAVEKALRRLANAKYISRAVKYHKVSGYRLVDKTKLLYAKPDFIEPKNKAAKTAKFTGRPPVKNTGHNIYRETTNPAEVFSVIKGGKL